MKFPKRLPYEILILSALLLGSCGQNATRRFAEGDHDRLDVAETNARNAIYRVNELEGRVDDLERRLR